MKAGAFERPEHPHPDTDGIRDLSKGVRGIYIQYIPIVTGANRSPTPIYWPPRNTGGPGDRLHPPHAPRREMPHPHLPARLGAGRPGSGLLRASYQQGHERDQRRRKDRRRGHRATRGAPRPEARAMARRWPAAPRCRPIPGVDRSPAKSSGSGLLVARGAAARTSAAAAQRLAGDPVVVGVEAVGIARVLVVDRLGLLLGCKVCAVEIAYFTLSPYEGRGHAEGMARALICVARSSPIVRRAISHVARKEPLDLRFAERGDALGWRGSGSPL